MGRELKGGQSMCWRKIKAESMGRVIIDGSQDGGMTFVDTNKLAVFERLPGWREDGISIRAA
jgi:hypothetical protein